MARPQSFRNYANALWKGITCSNSLPNRGWDIERQQEEQEEEEDQQEEEQEQEQEEEEEEKEENEEIDPQVWSIDLEKHSCGEFSHAVVQSRIVRRSYSQVEIGSNGLFVGIYDGHNGHHAAEYLSMNLMNNLISTIKTQEGFTKQALSSAFEATDEGFLNHVEQVQQTEPMIVVDGSSCMVGVIWKTQIFNANVGISEAVTGMTSAGAPDDEITAISLTLKHKLDNGFIRSQTVDEHPHDPDFVVLDEKDELYRVKGVSQICKSIGDAYLKREGIKIPKSMKKFRLSSPIIEPGLSSKPYKVSRIIKRRNMSYIFASPGFWDLVSKQGAVNIVSSHPRQGIAKRLLKIAVEAAATKAETTYSTIVGISRGTRLVFHHDMSVIVVFTDYDLVDVKNSNLEHKSFKGFSNEVGPSKFMDIDEFM